MPNIELIKNITTIASPLTKAVVDLWISPKIEKWGRNWLKKKKLQDHFFNNKFNDYLNEKYKTYSILNILAFRNQQRLIKDLYQPLTVKEKAIKINDEEIEINITSYKDNWIPKYKRVLLTDTAGMGKSTLSKIIFLSIIDENKGIPILIELRRLSKERKIIDEIFRELKLINENVDQEFVLDLIKRGDFIFILDGYDEIASKDKKFVTEDVQRFINNSIENNYLLTSRPDDSLASFGNFQEFSIKNLTKEEAYDLLKKYDNNGELSASLIRKLKDKMYYTVSEFLGNPLLVSLLYTAYEYKHTIPLKKHVFYRQVYDALFEAHDLAKGDFFQREKLSNLSIDDFHTIMRYISFICLKRDKIEFTKDELLEVINEANKRCEVIDFKEHDLLKDLISSVPLFVQEGIYYKWMHKSLYEYFAAQFIYLDTEERRNEILKNIAKEEVFYKYSNIIDIYSHIDYKTFRYQVVANIVKDFMDYCENSYQNIDIEESLIRERQELTYRNIYHVIQYKGLPAENVNSKEIYEKYQKISWKLLQTKFGIEARHSIRVSNYASSHITDIGFCYIFQNEKPELNDNIDYLDHIFYMFDTHDKCLYKKIKASESKDFNKLELEKSKIFTIDDKRENIINSKENFSKINTLLKIYYEGDQKLSYTKCLEFEKNMNSRKESEIKEDFLKI